MATETITGCVDFATGTILFAPNNWCGDGQCIYDSCMVWDGLHAGQVAVTISTLSCDDIYYGCVDFVTSEFKLVVPIRCCIICDPEYSATDCTVCDYFAADETPMYISATFSGVTRCSDDSVIDDFIVCLSSTSAGGTQCSWASDCYIGEESDGADYVLLRVDTGGYPPYTPFYVKWGNSGQLQLIILFYAFSLDDCPTIPFGTSIDNYYTDAVCGSPGRECYGGTVTLENISAP